MSLPLPINKLRAETPGCENVIHFNNAGAALMPQVVIDAVVDHLTLEANIGGYEAAEAKSNQIEYAYDALAALLGCNRQEVAFIENATRAWDMAFYSIPFAEGHRILTAQAEYVSNYIAFLQMQKHRGVKIEVIPNDERGQVSVTALENMLDDRVRLVAITHVPTNGGLVNPAEEIGRITKAAGILYLLDACQSVGQMPIDVDKIGCDLLSSTGRKYLRGPRGTGFLYVRRNQIETLEPPFLDLHAAEWTSINEYSIRKDAKRFENWETYYAGRLGLSKAIQYAMELGLDAIWERVKELSASFRSQLNDINGVTVTDDGINKCGIVTFTVDGMSAHDVAKALHKAQINVSVSKIEYARLDLETRGLPALVRASVHYYNTEKEIASTCEALEKIAKN